MFSPQVHRGIFFFGMISLSFGMMMGTVPTSVPQLILMGNWLLEGQFRKKWELLRTNKIFWILSSVFLAHVLGLFYTQDLSAGWDDVRTKIPLMFLPMLLFSTKPLSTREFKWVLVFFILGSVTNSLWCLAYTHLLHRNEEVRNASRFMSHIRLGLFLNMAICVCVYFWRAVPRPLVRLGVPVLIFYFLFCFYALGLASGLLNFLLLLVFFGGYLIIKQRLSVKLISVFFLAALFAGIYFYVRSIDKEQHDTQPGAQNVPQVSTPWGSSYIHFEKDGQKENGNFVLININLDELQRGWKRVAPEDSFNFAQQYNMPRYDVLVRYLASKGVNKDSLAINNLSKNDVQNIKSNIANYRQPGWSFFHRRVYEFVNEYDDFKNQRHVSGRSGTMRYYFWKAAWYAIGQHPLIGVGSGDVQQAMTDAYKKTHSPLDTEWYKRPHNQFLTVTVALGVIGFFILLISLIFPVIKLGKTLSWLYWPFLFIAILSFMVEDTLETQAGMTFFAFFNSLLVSDSFWKRDEMGTDGTKATGGL